MSPRKEKRHDGRIRFSWPLWFGYQDNGPLNRGQVVDLSQQIVSFTVDDNLTPSLGSHVLTRFSYPLSSDNRFDMGNYLHWSQVVRLDTSTASKTRVALKLQEQLPDDPSVSYNQSAKTAPAAMAQ